MLTDWGLKDQTRRTTGTAFVSFVSLVVIPTEPVSTFSWCSSTALSPGTVRRRVAHWKLSVVTLHPGDIE